MKDLSPLKGKYYIERLIAEGEHECQDFKFAISDARKIARSVSAFANCRGGRLLIGVKDNGAIAGVRNDEDIYVVEQAARRYCRPSQNVDFKAFNVGQGVVVIQASIVKSDGRPVMACDTDGVWKTFYRVADENIIAHPLMVRAWRMSGAQVKEPMILSLSATESRLLETIEEAGGLSPREIALRLHIASSTADDIIVKLAAIGIIDFRYVGNGEFVVVRMPDDKL